MDRNSRLVSDLLASSVVGKPAAMELAELVRESFLIARVHVERVETVGRLALGKWEIAHGLRRAHAVVLQPFKNATVRQKLLFLAEPTWVCDSSDAVAGETALLFLWPYTGMLRSGATIPEQLRHGLWQLGNSGAGRVSVVQGVVIPYLISDLDQYFPRPKGIEKYEPFPIPLTKFESVVVRLLQKHKR